MNAYDIILRPVITEQSMERVADKKYVFMVALDADKTQIKADITGKPIVVPASDTATTLGAVLLAGVGVGVYKDFDEAVTKTIEVKRQHTPDTEKRVVYDANYETYLELYQQLKGIMKKRGGNQ